MGVVPVTSEYNYATFDMAAENPHFEAFSNGLHVGDAAPTGTAEDLATGTAMALDSGTVLEFGSFT